MKKFNPLILLSFVLTSCTGFSFNNLFGDPVPVEGISFVEHEIEVEQGKLFTLKYNINPSNATNKNVTWSIEDTTIIGKSGSKFKALSDGTTSITVTTVDGQYTDTCFVTVTYEEPIDPPDPPSGTIYYETLTFIDYPASLRVGDTYQLEVGFTPSNADEGYYFYSSDENVVTISAYGYLTAVGAGTANIYVIGNQEQVEDHFTIEVSEEELIPVLSMDISKTSISVSIGGSYQLFATVEPSNATYNDVQWIPYDSNIISVDSNGVVTGLSSGATYVAAYTEEYLIEEGSNAFAYCYVTVTSSPIPATSIELSESTLWITVNESQTLTATIYPEDSNTQDIIWTSEDESIAVVINGVVYGVGEGYCYVYATCSRDSEIGVYCPVYVFPENPDLDPNIVSDNDHILTPESTDTSELYASTISASNLAISSVSYNTNFSTNTAPSGHRIGLYRYGLSSSELSLIACGDNSPAAIYNTTAYYGIKMFTVYYSSSYNFDIEFGVGLNYYSASVTIKSGYNQSVNLYIDTNEFSYFRLNGVKNSNTTISSVTVRYENDSSIYIKTTKDRIVEPTKGYLSVQYNPVNGEVKEVNGKEYTYYSHDYVLDLYESDPSSFDPSEYSYIDPIDVANYYCVFNAWPANYFSKSSGDGAVTDWYKGTTIYKINSTYRSIFGQYARLVSQYNRTTGYATSIPYRTYGDTYAPRYFEFDVDIDGTYSTNNRGVGRVVGFANGFTCYSNTINVALFTDDHYVTFRESLNNGSWGERFSGNSNSAEYVNRQYWC